MKDNCVIATLMVMAIIVSGCYAHVHKIGNGPQTGQEITKRQWYVIDGFVKINDEGGFGLDKNVDGGKMAGDAEHYEIRTNYSLSDILISSALNSVVPITVTARTVTVTK